MIDKGGYEVEKAVPQRELTPRTEKVDLPTAQRILKAVVSLHEDSFQDESQLDRIGDYSSAQVRQAFQLVSGHILGSQQQEQSPGRSISKNTPQGEASLAVFHGYDEDLKPELLPQNLELALVRDDQYILESEVPLRDPSHEVFSDHYKFSDFRNGTDVTTGYDLKEEFSMEKYRRIWRGTRWLAANLLEWEKNKIVMPEEMDGMQFGDTQRKEIGSGIIEGSAEEIKIKTKEELLAIRESSQKDIINRLDDLRELTRTFGIEFGGSLGKRQAPGGEEHFIASLDTGTEAEVIRSQLDVINFHTHPPIVEETRKRLEDDLHFDMPSQTDVLTFFLDPKREQEVIVGPYYTLQIEKQNEAAYAQAVSSVWAELKKSPQMTDALKKTGLGPAALIHFLDLNFIHGWEQSFGKKFDKNTWVDFLRKCGAKVSITEGKVELSAEERALKERENVVPGIYEPYEDRDFTEWVKGSQEQTISGLRMLQ